MKYCLNLFEYGFKTYISLIHSLSVQFPYASTQREARVIECLTCPLKAGKRQPKIKLKFIPVLQCEIRINKSMTYCSSN